LGGKIQREVRKGGYLWEKSRKREYRGVWEGGSRVQGGALRDKTKGKTGKNLRGVGKSGRHDLVPPEELLVKAKCRGRNFSGGKGERETKGGKKVIGTILWVARKKISPLGCGYRGEKEGLRGTRENVYTGCVQQARLVFKVWACLSF